jgi:hypothetical protein
MSAHPVGLRMGALFVVLFTLLSGGLTLERAIASRPFGRVRSHPQAPC